MSITLAALPATAGAREAPGPRQQDAPGAAGAQQAGPRAQQEPLSQELSFDGLFTVQYPGSWSELPSVYKNSRTLVSVPKSEHGRLSAQKNAYGLGERVARVMITIEQRLSHDEAVQRLKEIAGSYSVPATYLEIGGWPAVELSRFELRPLKGQSPGLQQPASEPVGPDRMTLHKTTAIAAGALLIRLEASMPPQGSEKAQRDAEAVGRSVRLRGTAAQAPAPEATAAALSSLRASETARATSPASDTVMMIPSAATTESSAQGMPGPGFPARVVPGGSELEIAASSSGRYVVIGTNGGYSYSSDAGRTWTTSGLTCPAGFTSCNGDPSLAVGKGGAFYYAIIGWPTGTNRQDPAGTASTAMYRSTNNGQAFTFVTNAVVCPNSGAGSCFPDQEHITADRNLAGTGGGDQVYSTWRNFDASDQDPAIVCSQDGGQNWSAVTNVGSGFVPRIAIGGDGFVYVIYRSGGSIMLNKYSPCSAGMTQQAGFPRTVTGVTDVTCPISGLDRCNDGNILSSHIVAADDINPAQIYVAYATNTSAGVNENVVVRASLDGGLTWDPSRVAQINTTGDARRFMPWACAVGGTAYVTWYDQRFGIPGISHDLTDFFGGSVSLDASNTLVPGPEFRISSVSDPLCASGWPCAPRATGDSETCPVQPQLAGVCGDGNPATADSGQRCDFTTGPACPAGEACMLGGGCPKYGDYNGNACAGGRLFVAWASATAPQGVTPASTGIDTFSDSRVVCCVPQIQTPGSLNFGTACSSETITKDLPICNQGKETLQVTGITSSSARYTVTAPVPGYPIDITPGNCQTLQVSFSPTATGLVNATLSIASNDPVYPTLTLNLSGTGGAAAMSTSLPNAGSFGDVCLGDFADLPLTIANTGACTLTVSNITSSSAEFIPPGVSTYPLTIEPGNSIDLQVRFAPTSQSPPAKSASITVDALNATDKVMSVSGASPPPDVNVSGSGEFGDVCAGVSQERTISVCNTGACPLQVTSVAVVQQASDAACLDFTIVGNPFPAPVEAGACLPVTVKYTPQSLGAHACRLKVTTSNDPDEPAVYIPLTANTPAPLLTVTPDQAFPATVIQSVGACHSALPFPVTNTGACPVTVQAIAIGGVDASNYSLDGAPGIPITINPGEQVGDGALKTVFKPDVLDRDRLGSVAVTWLSNPIANTTTTDTRLLCGEGSYTGARVLVRAGGVPVPVVEKIMIQRVTGNRNKKIVDTVDSSLNLALQTWTPAAGTSCQAFQYHKEYGSVSNPLMLAPGSYTVTASVVIAKKRMSKTVAFDATTCTFNPTVIIDF